MWEFIKALFRGIFWSYQGVASWFGFALFILWLLLPKIRWESKMKQRLEAVSWPYRLLAVLGLFYFSTIYTSYSIYADQQQKIAKLQQEIQTLKKQDTKQEIRILLESIKPVILQKIDAGQKDILVMMNIPTEIKLLALSRRLDFNKFLSIEQGRSGNIKDYIIDSNDRTWKANYRLYPKDALIK